jgi:hypothetical protein
VSIFGNVLQDEKTNTNNNNSMNFCIDIFSCFSLTFLVLDDLVEKKKQDWSYDHALPNILLMD